MGGECVAVAASISYLVKSDFSVPIRWAFQLPTSGRTRDSRERMAVEAPDSAVIPAQARNLRGACHGERPK